MGAESILYAGTIGQGVWRSLDYGETFHRHSAGMFLEAEVRALAVHPHEPQTLYAGTDAGIYRTGNGGDSWERLDTPFDPGRGWPSGMEVWSLLIHPRNPNILFAGICPSALYRSRDAGASWQKLDAALTPECKPILFSRVTCLLADPIEESTLWAGVEVDAVWRSGDMGESWQRLDNGLSSADIHSLAMVPGTPKLLIASTNNDLNISRDDGATWQPQNVKRSFPHAYCRGIASKSDDPRVLFLGNGNGPPGTTGTLQISRDGGESWQEATLPVAPNSTIWTFATHVEQPELIYGASINGYLYRSVDGGRNWTKCTHEFGEVRSLALTTASG